MELRDFNELIKTHDTTEDMIEKAFLSYTLANKIYLHQIKDVKTNYSYLAYEITAKIDNQLLISEYETTNNKSKKGYIGYVLCYKHTQAGQFETGRNYGIEALEIAATEDDFLMSLDISTALGQSFYHQGLFNDAREYFEKSLIYAEKSRLPSDLANAYCNLGNIENAMSKTFKALEYFTKAVSILEEKEREHPSLIHFYTNVATIYTGIGKFDEAKRYLKKSLKLNKNAQFPSIYHGVGSFYRDLGDFSLAMSYYKKGLEISKNKQDMLYIIECTYQIGLLNNKKERYKEAIKYFDEALDLAIQHDYQEVCFRVSIGIGHTYTKLEKYDKAKSFFDKALTILGLIDNDKDKLQFFSFYHTFLYETKQYEEAYKTQSKYYELKEKLSSDEQNRNMAYLSESFDSEQKTREVEFITKKNEELLVYQNEIINQKEDLIKLNEEKDAILLTISHDLKNSIGSIKSALDILALKEKEIFEHKYLKIINKST